MKADLKIKAFVLKCPVEFRNRFPWATIRAIGDKKYCPVSRLVTRTSSLILLHGWREYAALVPIFEDAAAVDKQAATLDSVLYIYSL